MGDFPHQWTWLRDLDEGGQGHTYVVQRAESADDTEYVLKRLKNPKRDDYFEREILACKKLDHPNVLNGGGRSRAESRKSPTLLILRRGALSPHIRCRLHKSIFRKAETAGYSTTPKSRGSLSIFPAAGKPARGCTRISTTLRARSLDCSAIGTRFHSCWSVTTAETCNTSDLTLRRTVGGRTGALDCYNAHELRGLQQ